MRECQCDAFELRTCECAVNVVCARCRGRREAPSGEACGSSQRGELRIPCGRRLNDASSEPRRPVLEGVYGSFGVLYRDQTVVVRRAAVAASRGSLFVRWLGMAER
jgi:hypothetical protein